MRNDSGIRQVYYVGGARKCVEVGKDIPDEHVTPDLRAVLSAPTTARRPGPPLKRLVEAQNAPGRMVEVGLPRTARTRQDLLSARPVLRAAPERLPGWLAWLASAEAPSPAWEVSDAFPGLPRAGNALSPAEAGALSASLATGMRRALSGEAVPGLRRVAPVPEVPGLPLVVLCCCDAPRWEVRALRGVLLDPDAPALDLVVFEDCSSPAASAAVREVLGLRSGEVEGEMVRCHAAEEGLPSGSTVRYLRRAARVGYTRNANDGGALYDASRHACVIWLNGDTDPGRGWLRALCRALFSGPRVGFACPMSDNNVDWSVPLSAGCSSGEMADALVVSHDGSYPEVFLPSGFCLAVRGSVWAKHGPYDEKAWGTGYGEETDLECKGWVDGWTSVAAPDSFVRHAKSRSFGEDAAIAASHRAIAMIRGRYPWLDKTLREKLSAPAFQVQRARASCIARLPGDSPGASGRVAFLTRSTALSGGNIAMFNAADALRLRGWDARVVSLDAKDADLYDADAATVVFDGEPDLRRSFRAEVFSSGVLVSGSYVTCDAGERLASDGGVRHVLFEQDDERRFAHNRDEGRRARIEAAWRDAPVIAVSSWVADAVEEVRSARGSESSPFHRVRPPVCRAGYDPLTWHPRPRAASAKLRVIAMFRPETAHRGGDLLLAALRILEQSGAAVEVTLFGSRPPPGVSAAYLGRIPHHKLARAVAGADVLVDASPFQGFGLDAAQALASGTALVCLDNGGCREYARNGENAVVLPSGSTAAVLADAIRALSRDASAVSGMQAGAAESVSALSWDNLASEWDAALRALLPGA